MKSPVLSPSTPHYAIGSNPECLNAVQCPDINLAVWQRPDVGKAFAPAMDALTKSYPFEEYALLKGIIILRAYPLDALPSIEDVSVALLRNVPGLEILADDVAHLYKIFAKQIVNAKSIRAKVFLENTPAMEREFHRDMFSVSSVASCLAERDVRLLATFHGPGTEWLENRGIGKIRGTRAKAAKERFIHRTSAGDVTIIIKGKEGVFHRSPVRWNVRKRVLLVMDPE